MPRTFRSAHLKPAWSARSSGPVSKAGPGRNAAIPKNGDDDAIREINLFAFPEVVGQGTRLFPDTGPDRALELAGSQSTLTGITIQVYRLTGRPQYATPTTDRGM